MVRIIVLLWAFHVFFGGHAMPPPGGILKRRLPIFVCNVLYLCQSVGSVVGVFSIDFDFSKPQCWMRLTLGDSQPVGPKFGEILSNCWCHGLFEFQSFP